MGREIGRIRAGYGSEQEEIGQSLPSAVEVDRREKAWDSMGVSRANVTRLEN